MNAILQKAVEELAKDSPNIAYVRGMLDTLLAMNTPQAQIEQMKSKVVEHLAAAPVFTPMSPVIEGMPPMPSVEVIKKLAEESVTEQ